MKKDLLLLIFLSLFYFGNQTCISQFKIYIIQGLSGDTMSIIDEKDINCIDWQHQSFNIKENIAKKIDKLPLLASSKYFFSVTLDSIEYYRVYVFSRYASHSIPNDCPYIIFYSKPIYSVFNDNWFVIRYSRKKENLFYEKVYDKKLYAFFSGKCLLKGKNWLCIDKWIFVNDIIPDKQISENFKKRFNKEY
jgi:hypothetical protein